MSRYSTQPVLIPGAEATNLACTLGVSPPYRQEELQRWLSAASVYDEMHPDESPVLSTAELPKTLRQRSQSQTWNFSEGFFSQIKEGNGRRKSAFDVPSQLPFDCPSICCQKIGPKLSQRNLKRMMKSEPISCLRCGSQNSPPGSLSLHKVSTINRSCASTNPGSRGESSLELEAIAAVHELSFAVDSISVSEMLPRTPDLIFVNVNTIEGSPYCLELTLKGWRITSVRHDCMIGDFTRLSLFTKYYDSLYDLMDAISPGYHALFEEKLAAKLRSLETSDEEIDEPATPHVTKCEPIFT